MPNRSVMLAALGALGSSRHAMIAEEILPGTVYSASTNS